jgi:hypothetical protein
MKKKPIKISNIDDYININNPNQRQLYTTINIEDVTNVEDGEVANDTNEPDIQYEKYIERDDNLLFDEVIFNCD